MGFTQVYTGDGKGKTTASMGLLLRAIGSGMSVYLGQFLKTSEHSDIIALKKLKKILEPSQTLTIKHFGMPESTLNMGERDIVNILEGYEDIKKALYSGFYDMVIADEINLVINLGIIDELDVIKVMNNNKECEFVLTGRCASNLIMENANLVSEIKKIKHYHDQGLIPRFGIEK